MTQQPRRIAQPNRRCRACGRSLLGVLACLVLLDPSPALAESRGIALPGQSEAPRSEAKLALIIGNASYEHSPLNNAGNDARDMEEVLSSLGFETMLLMDAGQQEMEEAIEVFGKRLKNGSVGLFYYAGHGVQVDGRNYLIPIGNRIDSRNDVKYRAVDLGRVMDELDEADNRLNILILDACRDNPFRGYTRGSGSQGLASAEAPSGTIIAYATAPGSVAADGTGRNGIYTAALLDQIKKPGLPVEKVFKQARIEVVNATDGSQTPWDSSSLTGDFFFTPPAPREPVETAMAMPSAHHDASDLEARADAMERRREAWQREQAKLEAAFQEAQEYEQRNIPYDLRADYWERFATSFSEDNPNSDRDDQMRAHAEERVAYWRSRKDDPGAEVEIASIEELGDTRYQETPEQAARAALEEYRLAYEARDIARLERVYIMNPEQREAMQKLFETCSNVSLRIDEHELSALGGEIVSVDIDQSIDFSGRRCLISGGGKATKMTATVIRRGSGQWVISSILPARN